MSIFDNSHRTGWGGGEQFNFILRLQISDQGGISLRPLPQSPPMNILKSAFRMLHLNLPSITYSSSFSQSCDITAQQYNQYSQGILERQNRITEQV